VKPSPLWPCSAARGALKRKVRTFIGLGVGEPDFATPTHIADAGVAAIRDGFTRYTAVEGSTSSKTAIGGEIQARQWHRLHARAILVSSGAKQTIYNLCAAILGSDDEASFGGFWVSYPDMVLLSDVNP